MKNMLIKIYRKIPKIKKSDYLINGIGIHKHHDKIFVFLPC